MLVSNKEKLASSTHARAFAELAPWVTFIDDNTVINKDGSLMVGFKFNGMDVEGKEVFDVDMSVNMIEHAIKMLPERVMIWQPTHRIRYDEFPDGEPSSKYGQLINSEWKKYRASQRSYKNIHYLFLSVPPVQGAAGFFDTVGRFSKSGLSTGESIKRAVIASFTNKGRFLHDTAEILDRLHLLKDAVDKFLSAVPDIEIKPLGKKDCKRVLSELSSPTKIDKHFAIENDDDVYFLDSILPTDQIEVTSEYLVFNGINKRYGTALTVKNWPENTYPGITDSLLAVDAEITISQAFLTFAPEKAEDHIKKVRTHNNNWRKGFFTMVKESVTKTESTNVNNDREIAANDADDALSSFTRHKMAGHYNFTIMVYGNTVEELEESVRKVSKVMQSSAFVLQRERLHLLSSFSAVLPGQWSESVRWVFFMGPNVADNMMIRTVSTGEKLNHYLSEQMRKPMPAISVFDTAYSTPYYFNFHQGDLGHAMVIGPSRSGKSMFMNFLISQFKKYEPSQVFIFDKDRSCRIPSVMQDGQHIDLNTEIRINPTWLLDEVGGKEWFAKWIEIPLTSRGYNLSAEDDQSIWSAIEGLCEIPREMRRLQQLKFHLPTHLSIQLEPWIGDGPQAKFFDHEDDAFSLSSFMCMEMSGILQFKSVALAFMEYAFYRISQKLTGVPTLIYVEEAWFMMEVPEFANKINDWLRTLAKKNAILVLATQSLVEISQSRHFNAMLDNIPCQIFLPNEKAHLQHDLYQGRFGLTDTQINTIKTMQRKREYYVVVPGASRKISAYFPKSIQPILDSKASVQELFDKHMATGLNDWRDNYYAEAIQH